MTTAGIDHDIMTMGSLEVNRLAARLRHDLADLARRHANLHETYRVTLEKLNDLERRWGPPPVEGGYPNS